MSTNDLAGMYRAYLDCLNERRWDDLGNFVDDELSYNGKPMSVDEYRAAREFETRAIPDLHFCAHLVVADADTVACRLVFTCTPVEPILGFVPTGRPITFAEHVFYRFRDRKIAEVYSLIDKEAITAQAGG